MTEWWNAMSAFEQAYWGIAALASLFFLIIVITTFIGGDLDGDPGDFDTDIDGGAFQVFTFRNIVGFFTLFGWTGIACIRGGLSTPAVIIISLVCGAAMMFAMAGLFYFVSKMVQSGSLKMENAIGAVGEVYLKIGPKRSTIGKIQVKVQGNLRELEAITDEDEELVMGNVIKVVQVINDQLLLVEKLK